MTNCLKIASTNVRSLRWREGNHVKGLMSTLDCNVLALQETHLRNDDDNRRIIICNPGIQIFFENGQGNSGGAALAFREDVFDSIDNLPLSPDLETEEDNILRGRVCAAQVTIRGSRYNFVCIYAPNLASDRRTFYRYLLSATKDLSTCPIILGDWNDTLSPLDRLPVRIAGQDTPVELKCFLSSLDLVDIFREIHPHSPGYTFLRPGCLEEKSRLDMIMTPRDLAGQVCLADIYTGLPSDHPNCPRIHLSLPPATPNIPSLWRMNVSHLCSGYVQRTCSKLLEQASEQECPPMNNGSGTKTPFASFFGNMDRQRRD